VIITGYEWTAGLKRLSKTLLYL